MTVKDALVVGIVFGILVGCAAHAFRSFRRLRTDARLTDAERRRHRIGGIASAAVATLVAGFVVFVVLRPPDFAMLQNGIFQGCQQRCVADGGGASLCDRYCTCYVRELSVAHGAQGLNDLIAAVSREQDPKAIATLSAQAQKCADQMAR